MNLGRLNFTKRNWIFFFPFGQFLLRLPCFALLDSAKLYIHALLCLLIDAKRKAMLLAFWKESVFYFGPLCCAVYKWITWKRKCFWVTTWFAPSCTGSRSYFPGNSSMHLPTQGGTCSGFPMPRCPIPACHWECGRLLWWIFHPQLSKTFPWGKQSFYQGKGSNTETVVGLWHQ